MKTKTIIPLLITLFSLISFTAQAVPPTISYQGYLTDPSGSPIDGNVNITFSLYDTANAANSSWFEVQTAVVVSKGLFNVQLGAVTPFASGQFDIPMWLGIKVGSDAEMSPRQILNSVGYALKAEDADTLGGLNSVDLNQSAHVTDMANPHSVTAVQTGAASIAALGAHTANSANPHNVTAAQTGAASTTALTTHSSNTAAHHTRYSDAEAVSAMSTKADNNPLHHDKYSSAQAIAAIKADSGTGLNADTVDNLHANEIIDAAKDEVRTPIPNDNVTFRITTEGSYYLTGNKRVVGYGVIVEADNVTIDLNGFSLIGDGGAQSTFGIYIAGKSYIKIKNGTIRDFTNGGIYQDIEAAGFNQVADVNVFNNGRVGGTLNSGIYFSGSHNLIERTVVSNNAGYGIYTLNNSTIRKNKVNTSRGNSGISCNLNCNVSENEVHNNFGKGILADLQCNVKDNSVSNNLGVGIQCFGGIIEKNIVSFNAEEGIKTFGDSIIENNQVVSSGGYGIYITNNTIVRNNVVSYSKSTGVKTTSKGNMIISNVVNFNNNDNILGEAGMHFAGGKNIVNNNVLVSNLRTSMLFDASQNTIENNNIIGTYKNDSFNGITFNFGPNYYANNKLDGHSLEEISTPGFGLIDGGNNIRYFPE